MDDGFENIGAAITGGLAARAVEPEHGEARADEHPGECANCSVPLIGPHCHFCGQKAHVHRTLTAILHDLIHGVLHLDGKFWRTLPLLVWRPGELTRRYAHGERAKFVSPLGMFLFTVFLMFAVLAIAGVSLANLDVEGGSSELARAPIESRLASDRERLGEDDLSAEERGEILDNVAELESVLGEIDAAQTGEGFTIISDDFQTGWARLDHGIEKLNANPGLALYKLQSNFYKFSWLLIPISVPFVWVLFFWTRRFRMYDHTVFVTYSLSFMSMLAIGLTALGFLGVGSAFLGIGGIVIPLWHMHRQLRGAYRLSWIGGIVRTVLLAIFCFITVMMFFMLLLGIGALG